MKNYDECFYNILMNKSPKNCSLLHNTTFYNQRKWKKNYIINTLKKSHVIPFHPTSFTIFNFFFRIYIFKEKNKNLIKVIITKANIGLIKILVNFSLPGRKNIIVVLLHKTWKTWKRISTTNQNICDYLTQKLNEKESLKKVNNLEKKKNY